MGSLIPSLSLRAEWRDSDIPPWVVMDFGSYEMKIHPYENSIKFEIIAGEASMEVIIYRCSRRSPRARYLRVDLTLDGNSKLSWGRYVETA